MNHKYNIILQKPYCCAMACLSMVLYRRSHKLYDQEELAIIFGVKIGEKYKNAFRESLDFITSHNYDEGINTLESIEQIQAFLTQE